MISDVVRVFHCDDSSSFRVLVREILADYDDVEMVGEAGSPGEALARVVAARPDVVLLDLLPPDTHDDLVTTIARRVPDAKIVVYSGYPVSVARERHPDACAYLEKRAPFERLVATIRESV
jgi:two-component system, NarL family, response regulator NreC